MAKNKHKQRPAPKRPAAPAAPAALSVSEPTSAQIARLDAVASAVGALNDAYGHPPPVATSDTSGLTLAKALESLEELLRSTRAHYENARSLRAEAHRAKTTVEAEAEAKQRELVQLDTELRKRVADLDARERQVETAEASLAGLRATLVERELNAERGFEAEKTRILKPIEDDVARLRAERERLASELEDARRRAEEESRARSALRDQAEAEERRAFDATMARERRERLEELRLELEAERAKAEATPNAALERRVRELEEREADADAREGMLVAAQKALRAEKGELLVAKEMLDQDLQGLKLKVERLVGERTEDLRHQLAALKQQLEDARERRDAYFLELEARRELERSFGDRTPEEILSALTDLERTCAELRSQLQERPDTRVAERLSELERKRSEWGEERAALQGELAAAKQELQTRRIAALQLETLQKEKEALEVYKKVLDGAVNELRTRVDELTRQDDQRNPMVALTALDETEALQTPSRGAAPTGGATPTLAAFAEDLRHRIAQGVEGRVLYYSMRDIRAFLGGLAMSRLMLLQGISGTGKTSLPRAFANAVGGGIEVVEVQAGWRDRQDLIGYYNAFHRHYYATNFLQALYKAGTPAYQDRVFLMVLDEINLSRPEQFFADFLSALEQPTEARRLTLVSDPVQNPPRLIRDGRDLPIPPNVWFVGTANHDESTVEFADKTYDRAHIMEMRRTLERFDVKERHDRPLSYEKLEDAFADAAEAQAEAVDHAITWLREAQFAADLRRLRVGWGNRLENQLARYLPVVVESGGSVGEAMDHLLATKVLRKLRDRHDVRVGWLETFREQLLTDWESLDETTPATACDELIEQELGAKKGEEEESA